MIRRSILLLVWATLAHSALVSANEAQNEDELLFAQKEEVKTPFKKTPPDMHFWQINGERASGQISDNTAHNNALPTINENGRRFQGSSSTDKWGKTVYYNAQGIAIGSSTVDVAGNIYFRDRNGLEVERLW